MNITLYENMSDTNVVDKDITQIGAVITGTLRDDCSVINPVIMFEGLTSEQLTKCNYAYIEEFGRYYFINNITFKNQLYELSMHVDVLMTYKDGIRNNSAVISRQEHSYNLYLQDGVFKTYSQPHIQIAQFPSGFSGYHLIFSVAG